jgi:hypothetical protein
MASRSTGGFPPLRDSTIDFEPRLVETVVLAARRDRREERAFRAERDRLYEIADPEAREAAFAEHHARWFTRLGFGGALETVLDEYPEIGARCGRCIVGSALTAADESADLLVAPPGPPTVLIRVRPETVCVSERFSFLLRRELLHVADMLDPAFDYDPGLGRTARGRLAERLLADRYRVVWDVWVDGRLARMGRAPSGVRDVRLREFACAFPGMGESMEAAFDRFFDASRCTHAEIVSFAANVPGASLAGGAPRLDLGSLDA